MHSQENSNENSIFAISALKNKMKCSKRKNKL